MIEYLRHLQGEGQFLRAGPPLKLIVTSVAIGRLVTGNLLSPLTRKVVIDPFEEVTPSARNLSPIVCRAHDAAQGKIVWKILTVVAFVDISGNDHEPSILCDKRLPRFGYRIEDALTWTHHRYTLVSDEGTPPRPSPSAKNVTGHAENFVVLCGG